MDNQLTPSSAPVKSNKVKLLIIVIIVLLISLVVAFAYIQAQQAANQEKNNSSENPTTVNVVSPNNQSATTTTGTKEILPGASLINPDNIVLDTNFEVASNEAIPNSPNAPKSVVIVKEDLPKETLNLEIGNGKIKPNSFTVKSGALISLAVTSADNEHHGFFFTDQAVGAIAMGVGPGQTKAINFNAPAPGEYNFECTIPSHKDAGEFGKMIVK